MLVRTLGAGGMGEVHEAIDTRNQQRVALKMLFEIDPAGVYRLKREFRRMADISHENLVALHELCNDGERWFYTMELLDGTDLRTGLQQARARSEADLRKLVRQLAHGVHALHPEWGCDQWTSDSYEWPMSYGLPTETDDAWSLGCTGGGGCQHPSSLYCFQQ